MHFVCCPSEMLASLTHTHRTSCNARTEQGNTVPPPTAPCDPSGTATRRMFSRAVSKQIPLPHVRWCVPLARLTQVDACGCKVMGVPPCCCQFSKFSTFLHTL